MNQYLLWQDQQFQFSQCRDCAVAGYLIVSLVRKASHLGRLDTRLAESLGKTLVQAASAVQEIIRPVKQHCAQFREETSELHFHVFPRSAQITAAYLAEYPGQAKLIHGPVLLDWACNKYRNQSLSGLSWQKIRCIQDRLQSANRQS